VDRSWSSRRRCWPGFRVGGTEKPKEEKVEGYAEWRSGGCLLVDAQRVCATPATKWKGGGATGLDQVPFATR